MIPAEHPLARTQALLAALVADADVARLGECLRGMHLPAIGGVDHPAEVMAQALALPTTKPELAFDLAHLLGSLLENENERLELAGELSLAEVREDRISATDEVVLFNSLLLACSLPADESLFRGVRDLAPTVEIRGLAGVEPKRLAGLLRYAQIYQQVDDSLEDHWLRLMETAASGEGPLSAGERGALLDAWRGLLWIPPSLEAKENGEVISFERIERGLLCLERVCAGRPGTDRFLARALKILADSFPRSPEFWRQKLAPRATRWPSALRLAVVERWSGILDETDIVGVGRMAQYVVDEPQASLEAKEDPNQGQLFEVGKIENLADLESSLMGAAGFQPSVPIVEVKTPEDEEDEEDVDEVPA